mmetsp:Transcript_14752/g.26022  ORF Transcript_14752/g.26022 Transcript_14752/m.26022 type:complete len:131 (+) Transcript_14752:569-961(+)
MRLGGLALNRCHRRILPVWSMGKSWKKASLEAIAFSLLMAGFYLGSDIMIYEVLKIGVNVIRRYEGYADLKAVYMCAYSETEAKQLVKVANEVFATSLSVVMSTRSVSTPSITKKSSNLLGRAFHQGIRC